MLRRIYTFYSQLCAPPAPDNVYALNRIRLQRLLLDCGLHRHGVSLAQLDDACGEWGEASSVRRMEAVVLSLSLS